MTRVLVALAAMFLTFAAATSTRAQDFPALFSVTGVANNDVLNIRQEPSARAPIVGTFSPRQTGIEVIGLSEDRRWGLVRTEEGVGWSAIRFLRQERPDSWQQGQQHLTCLGTEPFWNLNLFLPSNRAEFEDLATGGFELRTNAPHMSFTRHPATMAMSFNGARQGFAVIRQGVCSDGMSDRLYGLEVQLYWHDQPEGLSGCCMLGH
ncbi:SH3 domain-containing protein [Pararhodobacter sp.]|uniref:SH3 domain-containing protein n=1 Tax=Pararhodobacter sp. TaxID=2127056 RepID=UPI002AFE6165|nr:SH3 domain-containing protein [Pararhodobacter sp.]